MEHQDHLHSEDHITWFWGIHRSTMVLVFGELGPPKWVPFVRSPRWPMNSFRECSCSVALDVHDSPCPDLVLPCLAMSRCGT